MKTKTPPTTNSMNGSRMWQQDLGTIGGGATTVTTLIIFYFSTCLLSHTADAQEKGPRKVEKWSYLERMGEAVHDESSSPLEAKTGASVVWNSGILDPGKVAPHLSFVIPASCHLDITSFKKLRNRGGF